MTTLHESAVAPVRFAAVSRAVARAAATVATVVRNWKHRARLVDLYRLSDSELADMGITRGDLFDAGGSRWSEDPTRRLSVLRNERLLSAEMAARHIH
ncbi:hypothetical protein CSC94_15050 [Zhengella mangrovi]|uniref:DUF1127 domain-containing protein n=1 Tax=Zhengella mangrovi TaxID=1982044 RepID=A0A2G1QM06_9HYPH|nr:hypothetical protein [Zhengella mangrovi]PHP66248.1 hypothetical protein CSC94_15050 [Zhengella mangrovi]